MPGSAYFVFTKIGPLANIEPDDVPAQKVASLLVDYGVTTVVMNACRSATAFNDLSNAASLLVRNGIKTAIGMSFNVYSTSADSFTSDFYHHWMGQDVSILQAMSYARRRLRQNKMRISKYNTKVELEDYVVPILYYQESELHSLAVPYSSTLEYTGKVGALPDSGATSESKIDLIGREGDMLRIEWLLAQFPRIKIHLEGSPGVGKSVLLMEAKQWWQKTGLFPQVVYIQLTNKQFESCTTSTILASIAGRLNIDTKGLSDTKLISSLNKCSFLLVLDSIDSIHWSSQQSWTEHQHQFTLILKMMKNVPTVLLSRTTDDWLGFAIQSRLLLEPLKMSSAIAMGTMILHETSVPSRLLGTQEDQSFFEQLIHMSRGNPLAIKILMCDLGKRLAEDPAVDIASHILSLLQMRPVHLHKHLHADDGGARAVLELLGKAQRFLEVPEIDRQYNAADRRLLRPLKTQLTVESDIGSLKNSNGIPKIEKHAYPSKGPAASREDSKLTKGGVFQIMAFVGFWHNMMSQIEPFITMLAILDAARRDLKQDDFIRFRNQLCIYKEESGESPNYVKHALLGQESQGGLELSRDWIQGCLTVAEEGVSRFHYTLREELGNFITGPTEQAFGTSTHHFRELFYTLSPLLSLVFQSSDVRNLFSETLTDDIEVARDSLYHCRSWKWLDCNAIIPSSPFANALNEEIDFDFFNHLCRFLSCQRFDSWPVDHHWNIQYLMIRAIELDSRRTRLIEHVLNRFIKNCVQRINHIRQKYRDPQSKGYNLDSRDTNWRDWDMAINLEMACSSALLRAIHCQEMLLKPIDQYTKQWKFLSSRPMLLHSKTTDPDLKRFFLRILAANARWLNLSQHGEGLNAQAISDQLEAMHTIQSFHNKVTGLEQPYDAVNSTLSLPTQLYESYTAMMGGRVSTLYKAQEIIRRQADPPNSALLGRAVKEMEDLLCEEVEKSNDVQVCYQLHRYLAWLHDLLGNKAFATQHRAIAEDFEAILEPGVIAQMKLLNDNWKFYHRHERRSRGEPTNQAQVLERQLSRLKAELAKAESEEDRDLLQILQSTDLIADTLRDLGRDTEAIDYYERVIDGRKLILPATDRKTLLTTFARSKLLGQLKRFDESIADLRMLQEGFASIGEWKVHSNVTGTLGFQLFTQATSITDSCSEDMRARLLMEATDILETQAGSLEELFDPGDTNISIGMSNLAVLYMYQEQHDKAEALYQSAIQVIRTRTSNEADQSLIWTQNSLAACYHRMQKYGDAERTFKRILEICIEQYEPWHRMTLIIMSNLYDFYSKTDDKSRQKGFIKEYISRFHKSMQELASLKGGDEFDFLRPKYELGCKLAICDSYQDAINLLDEVSSAWLAQEKEDEEMLGALKTLRYCYASQESPQLEKAFETNAKFIEHSKSLRGLEHTDTLDGMAMQVVYLRDMGRLSEATEVQLLLIETRKRVLGDSHELTMNNISYLADIYADLKDWEAALKTRKEVFELRKAADPRSLAALAQMSRLAICHENLQQWDRVVEVRRDEYHKRYEVQGAKDTNTLVALTELAFGLYKTGEFSAAKTAISEAIDGRTEILGSAHVETLTAHRIKAMICRDLGQTDAAEEILRDVLAVQVEHPMKDLTRVRALAGLGRIYKLRGQVQSAREAFQEALDAVEELRGEDLGAQLDEFISSVAEDIAAL